MKTTKSTLAALAVICAILCSCSKENREDPTPEKITYFGEITSHVLTDAETLKYFDFYIMEYTATGEISKHNVTKWEDKVSDLYGSVKYWESDVKITLPGKLGFYLEIVPKAGIDMEAGYHIMRDYSCYAWSHDAGNTPVQEAYKNGQSVISHIKAGKLSDFLKQDNPFIDAVITFGADGKSTVSKWQ